MDGTLSVSMTREHEMTGDYQLHSVVDVERSFEGRQAAAAGQRTRKITSFELASA